MISGERNSGSNDEKVTAFFQAVTKTFFPCTEKLCLLVNNGAVVNLIKISFWTSGILGQQGCKKPILHTTVI